MSTVMSSQGKQRRLIKETILQSHRVHILNYQVFVWQTNPLAISLLEGSMFPPLRIAWIPEKQILRQICSISSDDWEKRDWQIRGKTRWYTELAPHKKVTDWKKKRKLWKLDPVGSTVRYEKMKLCTGSIIGHYEAVAVGTWWYWVSRGHLCLYILHKVEIWTGVTIALQTAWLTHRLWKIELLSSL